jgi:signal transduction histidine kinase
MEELRANSQSIVSQLNDTIWVLKKKSLFLTSISDRLKVFIQRMQSSYGHIKLDVVECIGTDHLLPPSQAFQLLQVLREAVNNAVRHSKAREIKVLIESDDSAWRITVADDGKGMSRVIAQEGNGLENMKSRSKEAGWEIKWQSNLPTGTRLTIAPTTN